ncbi:hypothetical protein V8C42DRAFT_319523 [Trichoderma barbatum]
MTFCAPYNFGYYSMSMPRRAATVGFFFFFFLDTAYPPWRPAAALPTVWSTCTQSWWLLVTILRLYGALWVLNYETWRPGIGLHSSLR